MGPSETMSTIQSVSWLTVRRSQPQSGARRAPRMLTVGILTLGLLATLSVYYPGLSGPFFFDDLFHIQDNPNLRLDSLNPTSLKLAAFSTQAGPLQRPLSMLSFALNYHLFGDRIAAFKAVNLGLHLFNGVLVFLLARMLFGLAAQRTDLALHRQRIGIAAALVAALWLIHPLNLTSVLYVVQRMTSLSALFVLLALLAYLQGRLRLPAQRGVGWTLLVASAACWLAGLASKENAILLPWYIFLIEWLFLAPLLRPEPLSRRTYLYPFAWLVVPLIAGLVYVALHPSVLIYDFRPFTLWERVLTEARVLWLYVGLILLPGPATLGIFHDDVPISTGLLTPWTTLPALLGLVVAAGWAIGARRRAPLAAFGILFFLAAHALESTVFPLEIMHEHRNYLAGVGLLFGVVGTLVLADGPRLMAVKPKLRYTLIGVFFAFFGAVTLGRALSWQDLSRLTVSEVVHHPRSASANYEAGRLYIHLRDGSSDILERDDFNAQAIQHFSRMAALAPQDAGGALSVLLANATARDDLDATARDDAIARLRNGLPDDQTLKLLLALSRCARLGTCELSAEIRDDLFSAHLANPRLNPLVRAALLDETALYAMKQRRLPDAEALFQEVIRLNPVSAIYQINYASVLIANRKPEAARKRLHRVLAQPQPVPIRKLAEAFIRYLDERSSPIPFPDEGASHGDKPVLSLQDLIKPREPSPILDIGASGAH